MENFQNNLRIYCWNQSTADRVFDAESMVWARMNYGHSPKPSGKNYSSTRPVEEVAKEVIEKTKEKQAGRIGVFLWHWGTTEESMMFSPSIESFVAQGFTDFVESYTRRFCDHLNVAGIEVDYFILDLEDGVSFWHFPGNKRDGISFLKENHPDLLNEYIRETDIETLWPSGKNYSRKLVTEFNVVAEDIKRRAIDRGIFNVIKNSFDKAPDRSNYWSNKLSFEIYDKNGWPHSNVKDVCGNFSSPVLYPGIGGNRYSFSWLNPFKREISLEEKVALNWVDLANWSRSVAEVTTNISPWFSRPSYGMPKDYDQEKWFLLWGAQLIHARSVGVNTFLEWSGTQWTDEECQWANSVFNYMRQESFYRPRDIIKLEETNCVDIVNEWVEKVKLIY